jgi:hypothetical protein
MKTRAEIIFAPAAPETWKNKMKYNN